MLIATWVAAQPVSKLLVPTEARRTAVSASLFNFITSPVFLQQITTVLCCTLANHWNLFLVDARLSIHVRKGRACECRLLFEKLEGKSRNYAD
ncbi:hypothetical protein [Paraburkholderia sp. BR14320]|uniref:hypothetical protein n=1 Tax=unclassified Paraburkholderia TaxID=2615204 RepID=UPI0034CF2CAB